MRKASGNLPPGGNSLSLGESCGGTLQLLSHLIEAVNQQTNIRFTLRCDPGPKVPFSDSHRGIAESLQGMRETAGNPTRKKKLENHQHDSQDEKQDAEEDGISGLQLAPDGLACNVGLHGRNE